MNLCLFLSLSNLSFNTSDSITHTTTPVVLLSWVLNDSRAHNVSLATPNTHPTDYCSLLSRTFFALPTAAVLCRTPPLPSTRPFRLPSTAKAPQTPWLRPGGMTPSQARQRRPSCLIFFAVVVCRVSPGHLLPPVGANKQPSGLANRWRVVARMSRVLYCRSCRRVGEGNNSVALMCTYNKTVTSSRTAGRLGLRELSDINS